MTFRVLIIGRDGQLSRALGEVLPAQGFEVYRIGRPEIDLLRPESITSTVGNYCPAVVINAAAYTDVEGAENEPQIAFTVNRVGAEAVALAAAKIGVPIVHFSTDYVFDGTKDSPYVETDVPNPLSTYGASKLAGDVAVASANCCHTILRTAWVCSPFGRNFVKTMLRLAEQVQEIRVVADQRGSPTFAHDIANVVGGILRNITYSCHRKIEPGLFHVTSSGETSWHGFAEAIMEGSAIRGGPSARIRAIRSDEYSSRVRRPAYSKLDCRKLAEVHQVSIGDWRAGLEQTLNRLLGRAFT